MKKFLLHSLVLVAALQMGTLALADDSDANSCGVVRKFGTDAGPSSRCPQTVARDEGKMATSDSAVDTDVDMHHHSVDPNGRLNWTR